MRRQILILGLLGAAPVFAASPPTDVSAVAAASAWLDLRQNAKEGAVQNAPDWVESITLVAAPKPKTEAVHLVTASNSQPSIFRIRVHKPDENSSALFVRLFFNDQPDARPRVSAWDATRQQLLRFGPLGVGLEMETSDSCTIPIAGVRNIDIEVPGDGTNLRAAYLHWMRAKQMLHPAGRSADTGAQPFSPLQPLHPPAQDVEQFGAVTATLSADTIRIGPRPEQAAVFEFPLEARPLLALISFEVAGPHIGSAPEVFVNGTDVGPATLMLPELADPGYRGEMRPLVQEMQFTYTGWVRAQRLVPAKVLSTGKNVVAVLGAADVRNAAIRSTQIELKYLWDKLDYILQPAR